MACNSPLKGWRKSGGGFTLCSKEGFRDLPLMEVPCGQCIGCRLDRSRMWATRIMHEASMYEENSFITLTYKDSEVPIWGSLVKKDLQNFWKLLRKNLPGRKIRYFACGEYGELTNRPHYHAIVFGYRPSDCVFYKKSDTGILENSPLLDRIWAKGYVVIGSVTFESAAYVARYCTKKITGSKSILHYKSRIPEFAHMSKSKGIGLNWLTEYINETARDGFTIMRGAELGLPRYYKEKINLMLGDEVSEALDKKNKSWYNERREELCDPGRREIRMRFLLKKQKIFRRENIT